jgi:hypothetical protein
VAAGREKVGHHHDLLGAARDTRVDRAGDARRSEREVGNCDAGAAESPPERSRNPRELRVRSALAAPVIDEQYRALVSPRAHQ